jgi:hypothetical protein
MRPNQEGQKENGEKANSMDKEVAAATAGK